MISSTKAVDRPVGASPVLAWATVGVLWVAGASNYLTRTMLTTMRGSIMESIPMTEAQFGLLTSIFLWVYAFASPLGGFFADRFSRKGVIIGSVFAWSAITWVTAYARTFEQLLLLRALLGLAEACYIPAAMAMIADYHRGPTRALATGIHMSGLVLGSVIGGLGGWIAERHGWNYAYTLIGLPNLIYCCVLALVLREAPQESRDHPVAPTAESVSFTDAFREIFRKVPYYVVICCWCLQGAVGWMIIGWMPTHMREQFSMGQGAAGFSALGYVYVTQFLSLWFGGFWSDRLSRTYPRVRLVLPGIAFMVAAPAFWLTGWFDAIGFTILSLILWGLAEGFLGANMMPIICMVIDARYRATALGVLNCFTACFGGASIYLVGALRDAQVGIGLVLALAGLGVFMTGALLCVVGYVLKRSDPAATATT